MANHFMKLYEHDNPNPIGYEERDEEGRLICIGSLSDEECEEIVSFEYFDEDRDIVSKETLTVLEKGKVKRRVTEYSEFVPDTAEYTVTKRIIIEEFNNDNNYVDDIEFDIEVETSENLLTVHCYPKNKNDNRSIIYIFDKKKDDLLYNINSVFNTYYGLINESVDDTDNHIISIIKEKYRDGTAFKSIIHTYDNGLYEKTYLYSIDDNDNDKFIGVMIRAYNTTSDDDRHILYEYHFDTNNAFMDALCYSYENGKLNHILDKSGNILFDYVYDNEPIDMDHHINSEYSDVLIDRCIVYDNRYNS